VDPSPFSFPGEGRAAALCLHGLTGTPYEVRPLGRALAARGIAALGPALPGHNETPDALSRVPHGAWIEAARAAAGELRARHERVFAVGLSMGGLLSLLLAAEGRVDAVVAVGTPLRLSPVVTGLVPVLKRFFRHARKQGGSNIHDEAARLRHPSYPLMPLASVHELIRLQRLVRAALPRVRVPLLVAHGALDRTADPADAREILGAVTSEDRALELYASSAHIVPVDRDGPALAESVAAFLARRT
jgi:carboxylesterase